ncbi:MAG TPA: NUDIX hydrolase [Candidatus Dojkabacteria bacterium]|nr:NUDIX hydrolase [Candidatus Dojkabacteria bacterium]HQF36158.1 NUDIX hydrolase [Candidatus Dojkabacteria bacterium]
MGENKFTIILLGAVFIKDDNGKVLLVQEAQDKKYSKCKDKWTIPHGGYDKFGESIKDLVSRKLLEEAGFECQFTGNHLCVEGYDLRQKRIVLVSIIGEGRSAKKVQERLIDEIKDVRYFSESEIAEMIRNNQIRDNLPIDKIIEAFEDNSYEILRWELDR